MDDLSELTNRLANDNYQIANDNRKIANDNISAFKAESDRNNKEIISIVKDIGYYFNSQKNNFEELSEQMAANKQSTNDNSNKIESTNQLLSNSIFVQKQMVQELGSISELLSNLNQHAVNQSSATKSTGAGLFGSVGEEVAMMLLKRVLPFAVGAAVAGVAAEYNYDASKIQNSKIEDWASKHIPGYLSLNKSLYGLTGGVVGINPKDPNLPENIEKNSGFAANDVLGKRLHDLQNGTNQGGPRGSSPMGNQSNGNDTTSNHGGYSAQSAAKLAIQAGATPEEAKTLGAIAMAESNGGAKRHNTTAPDDSYGLWQINLYGKLKSRIKEFGLSSAEDLYDPLTNAKAAIKIMRESEHSRNHNKFQPWSTFTSGAYRKYYNPNMDLSKDEQQPTGETGNRMRLHQDDIIPQDDKVSQIQRTQAAIRKQPIKQELKDQLNYAATQNDVQVEVYSGGQSPAGFGGPHTGSTRHDNGGAGDLRLFRMIDGKKQYLDQTNPSDKPIMEKFIQDSVKAGATGVGSAVNYMGPLGIHIGGGTPAAWGAGGSVANAPEWVSKAWQNGMKEQKSFNIDEWKKNQQKPKDNVTQLTQQDITKDAIADKKEGLINPTISGFKQSIERSIPKVSGSVEVTGTTDQEKTEQRSKNVLPQFATMPMQPLNYAPVVKPSVPAPEAPKEKPVPPKPVTHKEVGTTPQHHASNHPVNKDGIKAHDTNVSPHQNFDAALDKFLYHHKIDYA